MTSIEAPTIVPVPTFSSALTPKTSSSTTTTKSDKPNKKDKEKWWKTKRENKKAKRTIEANTDATAEKDAEKDGDESPKKKKAKKNKVEIDTNIKEEDSSKDEATPPAPVQKQKQKKTKSKAMSKHANYSTSTTTTSTTTTTIDSPSPPNTDALPPTTSTNDLEIYATNHSALEPPLLTKLRAEAKKVMPNADHMQSGHLQGRLLKTLVSLKGAKRILEIGTFVGYSALCMAEGLAKNGEIVTCEIDPEAGGIAKAFFERSIYKDNIRLCIAPAMDTLVSLNKEMKAKQFDMVFIDADKRAYRAYYDYLLTSTLLTPDALILCDNVLFKGMVCRSANPTNGKGLGGKRLNHWAQRHQDIADELHGFNGYVNKDRRVEVVLLPVRDGLTLIRRVEGGRGNDEESGDKSEVVCNDKDESSDSDSGSDSDSDSSSSEEEETESETRTQTCEILNIENTTLTLLLPIGETLENVIIPEHMVKDIATAWNGGECNVGVVVEIVEKKRVGDSVVVERGETVLEFMILED